MIVDNWDNYDGYSVKLQLNQYKQKGESIHSCIWKEEAEFGLRIIVQKLMLLSKLSTMAPLSLPHLSQKENFPLPGSVFI